MIARVRSGWSKFRELLPLLTSRALPLLTNGRVYQACVCSVMYGSETWPVRAEDMCCMERNDMQTIYDGCTMSASRTDLYLMNPGEDEIWKVLGDVFRTEDSPGENG